jgi:hypothetical protein
MASITKNIANTGKLAVSGTSTILGIITNPFFWILLGILFFPLDILNYLALAVVNIIILFVNLVAYIFMIIIFAIINLAGSVVNLMIDWFNDLSIEVGGIDIGLPNLPNIPTLTFPTFGIVPYRDIEDVRIFEESKILILYILELLGISFPF